VDRHALKNGLIHLFDRVRDRRSVNKIYERKATELTVRMTYHSDSSDCPEFREKVSELLIGGR
jgi:hypothetical protein